MSLAEKFQQTVRKHPFKWGFVVFVFGTFPQWLSGIWALFSSEPLFQWLESKGLKMPTFSPIWITFPIGIVFLAYIARQSHLHRKEVAAGKDISATDANNPSDLEIEFIPGASTPAKKHPCQIRIRNNNPKRNADDLKVELLSFTDELSGQFPSVAKAYFHPIHFGKVAELKSATGRNTINPCDELEFTVFYFEMGTRIQGQHRSFVATFDLNKTKPEENSALFHEKKAYRIKFAASARDMSRIEKEFKMEFSDQGGVGHLNLTPSVVLAEKEKRDEVLRQLGE